MTIVRRFLLAPSLARLIRKERGSARVTEGYFPTQSGRNSHVLVEAGQCHLVLVTPEDGATPLEERTEVPRAHADALLDVCPGRTVYERSRVAIGSGREALVDRITVPGALDMASVEFESRDAAAGFHAAPWFGPEVTADVAYDRRSLALNGVPGVGEIPLSNEALESLLDLLEDRPGRGRLAPAPRRTATDNSVIDALRRLASPDPAVASEAANGFEAAPAADGDEASARPLPRRNFSFRSGEPGQAAPAPEANGDTRIDDVIASLSEALGPQAAAPADDSQPAMPDVEQRPVTRLRRFG